MITKSKKQAIVSEIKENISKSEGIFLTNLIGVPSNNANEIRKKIRDAGGDIIVARNTLFKKGAEGTALAAAVENLKGSHALAFAFKDSPAVAKILYETSKDLEFVELKAGTLEGKLLTKVEVESLAKLPSRDQMLATLLATFNAPISAFVRVMDAIAKKDSQGSEEVKEEVVAEAAAE